MARIAVAQNTSRPQAVRKKAAELFKVLGYRATSMRHLAGALGVEAPSLYNHIGSKKELLAEICNEVANAFTTHLEALMIQSITPVFALEQVVRFHVQLLQQNFNEVFVANHEWKNLDESELLIFQKQRRQYEANIVKLVRSGIASGQLIDADPYLISITLLSALRGMEFLKNKKGAAKLPEIENDIVHILLNGIKK